MHEALHVAVLAATVVGVGALLLLVLWPVVSDAPLSLPARRMLLGLVVLAALAFLVEWRVVH